MDFSRTVDEPFKVETNDFFLIRVPTPADAGGIGRVHVDSWRTSYKDIIDSAFLSGLKYRDRIESAAKRMENPLIFSLVVEDRIKKKIIGFAEIGPSRHPDDTDAELYAIYLEESHHRMGLGRQVFKKMLHEAQARHYQKMLVSVLTANKAAISFYLEMSGVFLRSDFVKIEEKLYPSTFLTWALHP